MSNAQCTQLCVTQIQTHTHVPNSIQANSGHYRVCKRISITHNERQSHLIQLGNCTAHIKLHNQFTMTSFSTTYPHNRRSVYTGYTQLDVKPCIQFPSNVHISNSRVVIHVRVDTLVYSALASRIAHSSHKVQNVLEILEQSANFKLWSVAVKLCDMTVAFDVYNCPCINRCSLITNSVIDFEF